MIKSSEVLRLAAIQRDIGNHFPINELTKDDDRAYVLACEYAERAGYFQVAGKSADIDALNRAAAIAESEGD